MQRDLVIRAQGSDHAAFTALVAGSVDRLFNVARLILRSNDLAEDAVEEALLRAWTTIRELRDPDRFDAWIHQLVVRACYRSARQERGRRAMDISHISIVGARGRDAEQSVARRDQLEHGFRRLAPDQRAVLVVYRFLELRDHEAEEALGIRPGTLESRLNRATRALGAALEAEERQGVPGAEADRMTSHDALDRTLGEWFHTDARERAPSSLLDAVSAGVRRLPLRTAWRVALRRKGQRLAIETYAQTPDSGQISTIYLVDPDGSPTIRIDAAAGPNWSPDGRYLLVANQEPAGGGDTGTAAVMNGDGTGRTDLPATGLDPRSLVWTR